MFFHVGFRSQALRKIEIKHFVALVSCLVLLSAGNSYSGIGTTVPVSAELSTSIAGDLFPLTLSLENSKVFVTAPTIRFLDAHRIGIHVRFQAYDHRPEMGIAISEMGNALISGQFDYDRRSQEIILLDPRIERLEFDRKSNVTRDLAAQLQSAWRLETKEPIRTKIPPHPYTQPIKNNIEDLSYDGSRINIKLSLR
jgi:hypothetical protein